MTSATSAADLVDDLSLLRRFEPVLRLTAGEMFHPVAVEDYLADAALLTGERGEVVVRGLTPESLVAAAHEHDGPLSLQYVDSAMSFSEYRAWRRAGGRPAFTPGNAAVAVGLVGRILATLARLTLLIRGKVPGSWAAAASQQAQARDPQVRPHYYGRVLRDAGWLVLQYWYLYPMNDWRSSFGGVNDHEGDWEQVTLFAVEDTDDVRLAWVAFSSHDEKGADLRRRVDDPDITWVGEHPVVYAGAGSHSGAYLPGEYLTSVPLALPAWLRRLRTAVLRIIPWADAASASLGVAYLDYRRGDGLGIGPDQEREWTPVLIGDHTPWVREYTGLWGLDTRDPLGGERAPAGPRYERDASVRPSWAQPVAWADLDGERPVRGRASHDMEVAALLARRAQLERSLDTEREALRQQVDVDHANGRPVRQPSEATAAQAAVVANLRRDVARVQADLAALRAAGPAPSPPGVHEHLSSRPVPLSEAGPTRAWFRRWASVSSAVVIAALGIVLLATDGSPLVPLLAVAGAALLVEAALRGRLLRLLLAVAAAVTILALGFVLVRAALDNARDVAGWLLVLAAGYLAVQGVLGFAASRPGRVRPAR